MDVDFLLSSPMDSKTPNPEAASPHSELGTRDAELRTRNAELRTRNAERSVGFKEWALVCDSMLRGETSLIFRKGGIAEGREGFRFKFKRFYLFPTYFHEQIDRLRLGASPGSFPQTDSVAITGFAEAEFTSWIDDLRTIEPLESLHLLNRAVLKERFRYNEPQGLYLAFIRAYKLSEPWRFPFRRSYGGCRSWVDLPTPPAGLELEPVLNEDEHARRRELVVQAVGPANCDCEKL